MSISRQSLRALAEQVQALPIELSQTEKDCLAMIRRDAAAIAALPEFAFSVAYLLNHAIVTAQGRERRNP